MKIADQMTKTAEIFLQAVQEGNIFLCNALLEPLSKNMEISKIVDAEHGGNALHWAANNGHFELVSILIEKFPSLIDSQSNNGSTPTLNAVVNNHTEIALFLSQQGANLAIANKLNQSVLLIAATKSDDHPIKKECREFLNQRFIDAVRNKEEALAVEWLNKGADVEASMIKSDDKKINYTALFHACSTGDVNLAKLLIARKANINMNGAKNGFTPLHAAVFFGYQEIVEALHKAGAILLKDATGQTPLEIAKSRNMQSMINILSTEVKNESPEIVKVAKPINISALDQLKKDFSLLTPPRGDSIDELQARVSQLAPRVSIPTKIFDKNQSALFSAKVDVAKKAETVGLSELKEKINLISKHIDNIEKEGNICIKGFNAKCSSEDMKVDVDQFTKNAQHLQKLVKVLHDLFNGEGVAEITRRLTVDCKLHIKVSAIENIANDIYHTIHNKIIRSQEYGNAYSNLYSEIFALEQEANNFVKKMHKIHDKEIEIADKTSTAKLM